MENHTLCMQRAERDRAQAEDPATTPLMRERLLESARRWEEMAVTSQHFDEECKRREEDSRKRVEARKAGVVPAKQKRVRKPTATVSKPNAGLPVLLLRKSMIYHPPEPFAIAAE